MSDAKKYLENEGIGKGTNITLDMCESLMIGYSKAQSEKVGEDIEKKAEEAFARGETTICAAFCGTGKSYLCNNFPEQYAEVECWHYQGGEKVDFPDNCVSDILSMVGKVKYLMISTNPAVLKRLTELGFSVNLYYHENGLKTEYFERYGDRESHPEFMVTLDKHISPNSRSSAMPAAMSI